MNYTDLHIDNETASLSFEWEGFYFIVTFEHDKTWFEVFNTTYVPICIDFEKRIYSETDVKEVYPKSKDFGVWAWTYNNKEEAIKKANDEESQ